MYIKLPPTYVDPATRALLPEAILVITDADFKLRGGSTVLQTAVYASAAAYSLAGEPVSERQLALSPTEIQQQVPALLQACYTTIMVRAEFAHSTMVVP